MPVEMVGQPRRPLFVENGVFGQHAVQRAAELVDEPGIDAAVDPAGEIAACHAIADGKAGDGIADGDNITGPIAQRNDAVARRQRIRTVEDHRVAPVERGGANAHHDLMRFRLRLRRVAHHQAFGPAGSFKTVAAHVDLLKKYVD